ncbi:MAG: DUF58 domain-containing protein [Ruminococcus sp.]|nr:DUF58 domain-containing protein [Ruminococcus sp.]
MKKQRLTLLLLTAIGLAVWCFSPAGAYILAGISAAALAAAAENLFCRKTPEIALEKNAAVSGEPITALISCGERELSGRLKVSNLLSGDEVKMRIRHAGGIPVRAAGECGGIELSFEELKRYDLLGLTYRRVRSSSTARFLLLPAEGETQAGERQGGDREISGAREYREGDDLRRINFKLTHRFSELYVNELEENEDEEELRFEHSESGDRAGDAGRMAKLIQRSMELCERGTRHSIVIDGRERCEVSGIEELTALLWRIMF